MSENLHRLGKPIDAAKMDVANTVEAILDNGHAIHGETMWIDNRDRRVVRVIEEPVFDDWTPVIGYGRGDTADQALLRALYTYAMDKPRRYVDPDELPESSTSPLSISSNLTQLDFIVKDGDIRIHRQTDGTFAESTRDRDAGGGTYVGEGQYVVSAVKNLVDNYPFPSRNIRKLPVTLLWDFTDNT